MSQRGVGRGNRKPPSLPLWPSGATAGPAQRKKEALRRVLTTPRPVCIIICSQVAISRRAARKGRPAAHFARGMPPARRYYEPLQTHPGRPGGGLRGPGPAGRGAARPTPRPEGRRRGPRPPGTGSEAETAGGGPTTFPLLRLGPGRCWARRPASSWSGCRTPGWICTATSPPPPICCWCPSCDLFLYVGGTSDSWVDDALQEAVNQDMEVLKPAGRAGQRRPAGRADRGHAGRP